MNLVRAEQNLVIKGRQAGIGLAVMIHHSLLLVPRASRNRATFFTDTGDSASIQANSVLQTGNRAKKLVVHKSDAAPTPVTLLNRAPPPRAL